MTNVIGQSIWDHKIHGMQYEKIHSAHKHGHKIIYFICFYIMQLEPTMTYIDGRIKNI